MARSCLAALKAEVLGLFSGGDPRGTGLDVKIVDDALTELLAS